MADVSDALGLSGGREPDRRGARARPSARQLDVEQLLDRTAGRSWPRPTAQRDPDGAVQPVLRTPTPDNPLKLWVGGDSVGEIVRRADGAGVGVDRVCSSRRSTSTVGTGLTRPDFYNWPEHFAKDVLPNVDPDIVMPMFGANDDQNMELPDGTILTKYTPEWFDEYRRRVGATMDLLKSPDNDRLVVWVGLGARRSRLADQQSGHAQLHLLVRGADAAVGAATSTRGRSSADRRPDHSFAETCLNADGEAAGHVPEGQPAPRDHGGTAVVVGVRSRTWAAHRPRRRPRCPAPPPSEAHRPISRSAPSSAETPGAADRAAASSPDQGWRAVTVGGDAAADVPERLDGHAPRGDGGDQVVEDAVGDVLVERALVAVAPEVELQRLELDDRARRARR